MTCDLPYGYDDWYYYEFNNGYLAYTTDEKTICFQDLRATSNIIRQLELPLTIGDFTFDLAQDVLIVMDTSHSFVPVCYSCEISLIQLAADFHYKFLLLLEEALIHKP